MIEDENDYDPVIYEQLFLSHIYENQFELLLDYYNRPTSNNIPQVQEVNEINTVNKPEKDQVPRSSSNHIYQNIKKNTRRKNLDNLISPRKPKK